MASMETVEEVLKDWEAVIGLEIHCELTTLKTKMFCGCALEHGAEPNTNVCPVCLGLPGALPVPNKAAVQSIVLSGLATNCKIMKRSMFYRKNYFYPDMAKNFQTTQGPIAFCMDGWLDLEMEGDDAAERHDVEKDENGGYVYRVGIERIHLEEDAAKMIHVGGTDGRIAGADHSLIDYNRAGTPLTELVTRPDLRTPAEARRFMQKLRQIYLALGISDCSMEDGSMRCDGNISLRRRAETTLDTKTELKNLNSFKSLHDGLAYEIVRQARVLESGGTIKQETRHWDITHKRTVVMRTKETADDYRFFPEPDLAPYDLSDEFIDEVRALLPELPEAKKARYQADYGLPSHDALLLADDGELGAFFEQAVAAADGMHAQRIANYLLNDLPAALNAVEGEATVADTKLTPEALAGLAKLQDGDVISSKQGKQVFAELLEQGGDPEQIVEARGMKQVSDTAAIEAVIDQVLAANPDKVAAYQGGKKGLQGFFMGQCMKAMKGQGNPKVISQLLAQKLDS